MFREKVNLSVERKAGLRVEVFHRVGEVILARIVERYFSGRACFFGVGIGLGDDVEAEIAAVAFVVSDVGDNEVAGFVGGKGFPINIAPSRKMNTAIGFGGLRFDDLAVGGDGEEVGAGAGVV